MRHTRSSRVFSERLRISIIIASNLHSRAAIPIFLCGIAVGIRVLEWKPQSWCPFRPKASSVFPSPILEQPCQPAKDARGFLRARIRFSLRPKPLRAVIRVLCCQSLVAPARTVQLHSRERPTTPALLQQGIQQLGQPRWNSPDRRSGPVLTSVTS